MDTNPYHAPTADPFGHSSAVSSGGVTEGVLRQLKGTKGWVKFMAVLCFLAAALMVLLGLLFLGVGIVGGSAAAAAAGVANTLARMGGMLGGVVIRAIYAVIGAITFYQ